MDLESLSMLSTNEEGKPDELLASQQALELRKFFEPFDPLYPEQFNDSKINPSLIRDGALDAYTENVIWRLHGVRVMVTLLDGKTQYFLAGTSCRHVAGEINIEPEGDWFGSRAISSNGGLWEITAQIDCKDEDYPCFIVPDLTLDPRFSNLPMIDGTVSSYRFYAGTPITTSNGVNIGSVSIFDDKPRLCGLSSQEKKYLHEASRHVMKHLEIMREAAERRRVSLMSKGIATFLERITNVVQEANLDVPRSLVTPLDAVPDPKSIHLGRSSTTDESSRERRSFSSITSFHDDSRDIFEKNKMTLDCAAEILKESLELHVGGVLFLDTALPYSKFGLKNAYFDTSTHIGAELEKTKNEKEEIPIADAQMQSDAEIGVKDHAARNALTDYTEGGPKGAKVLAMSVANVALIKPGEEVLDGKTLQTLINVYPKGNVWYFDKNGYFSSMEQVSAFYENSNAKSSGRNFNKSSSKFDDARKRAEANLLLKTFCNARQIIFIPIWDAGGDRWHSGCFAWSQSAVPVFTVESEIAYLSAFTNSVMVEISRLDALIANRMKTDFISSISHEFRSPLHGILASAEFLRESEMDPIQTEYTTIIQSCGSTLLDTINHVLDYSKINSFESSDGGRGMVSDELYQTSNIALLCEEIISTMVAAKEFSGIHAQTEISMREWQSESQTPSIPLVNSVLDFESREWNFKVQPGALRRIVMNLFENAMKYTSAGLIIVRLRIRDNEEYQSSAQKRQTLALNIIDSGRGISSGYISRKLFTPFAQEDTFSSGVGLGLSIVYGIVSHLHGKIQVQSEVGKGTDVEVLIPLEEAEFPAHDIVTEADINPAKASSLEFEQCVESLKILAPGKTITMWDRNRGAGGAKASSNWELIERYCSEWCEFEVTHTQDHAVASAADLVIIEEDHTEFGGFAITFPTRVLLIRKTSISARRYSQQRQWNLENIYMPIGPFKLAKAILGLFESVGIQASGPVLSRSQSEGAMPTTSSPSACTEVKLCSSNDFAEVTSKASELTKGNDSTPTYSKSNIAQAIETLELETETPQGPQPVVVTDSLNASEVQPPQTSRLTPLHILIVDDNKINLDLLCRYLSKRKSDIVIRATSGIEAVAAVLNSSKLFDVIFMDISMPEMDGFEATCVIRDYERNLHHDIIGLDRGNDYAREDARMRRAYIIALTGLASRRDRDIAEECGVDDFWTKPVSFKKVGELLERMGKEKRR